MQQHQIPECNTALSTVFIKGLSKGTTEKCIQSLFGKFGTLIDCQASYRSCCILYTCLNHHFITL